MGMGGIMDRDRRLCELIVEYHGEGIHESISSDQ